MKPIVTCIIGYVGLCLAMVVLPACPKTPTAADVAQQAAMAAEATDYAIELSACRTAARLDGGWDAYEACAERSDIKHHVTDAGAGQ